MSKQFKEFEEMMKFMGAVLEGAQSMEQMAKESQEKSDKAHEEVLKQVKFNGTKETTGYDSFITADIVADALEIHRKVYDLKNKMFSIDKQDKFNSDQEGYASVQFIRFIDMLTDVEETTLALAHVHMYDKETINNQCKENGVEPLELAVDLMLRIMFNN